MTTNMKTIFENYRKSVKEEKVLQEQEMRGKLDKIIQKMREQEDSYIAIVKHANIGRFVAMTFELYVGGILFGEIDIEQNKKPCLNSFQIVNSESEKGFGPIIYEVALEWSSMNGGGLTSDRYSVSSDASSVWDKYVRNRSDVKKAQMDIDKSASTIKATIDQTDYKDKDEIINLPQLTPNIPDDDCVQVSSTLDKGLENWNDSDLSKVYFKEEPEVMEILKKLGMLKFR